MMWVRFRFGSAGRKLRQVAPPAVVSALLAVSVLVPGARAASGRVVNPDGRPVRGARVCYMIQGSEQICVDTDENGAYRLPGKRSTGPLVRIVAPGFLVQYVRAEDYSEPIVLQWAASLRLRVVDAATGEPIPKGKVTLMTASGRKLGPLPFNAAGLRLPRLYPGDVIPMAVAEGYVKTTGDTVRLIGGEHAEVTLKLRKVPPPGKVSGNDQP